MIITITIDNTKDQMLRKLQSGLQLKTHIRPSFSNRSVHDVCMYVGMIKLLMSVGFKSKKYVYKNVAFKGNNHEDLQN